MEVLGTDMLDVVFVAKSQCSCSCIPCHVFKERKEDITHCSGKGAKVLDMKVGRHMCLYGENRGRSVVLKVCIQMGIFWLLQKPTQILDKCL